MQALYFKMVSLILKFSIEMKLLIWHVAISSNTEISMHVEKMLEENK